MLRIAYVCVTVVNRLTVRGQFPRSKTGRGSVKMDGSSFTQVVSVGVRTVGILRLTKICGP